MPLEIETMKVREQTYPEQNEVLDEVIINDLYPEQKIKVDIDLDARKREQIIYFLWNNTDVFAWKVEDMEGISEEVMLHHLDVDPNLDTNITESSPIL